MSGLPEAQERITFAAEGVALAAADAFDLARDHASIVLASLAALTATLALALTTGGGTGETGSAAAGSSGPAATSAYVSERGYSLSLPDGWERTQTPDGSVFSAASGDGLAESTLWVEREPKLGFNEFVDQSKLSLDQIASNVHVSDQVAGPTIEARIAELRGTVPLDGNLEALYRVTLRASGPYRYYLATLVQPGAPPQRLADAEILGSSFRPDVK